MAAGTAQASKTPDSADVFALLNHVLSNARLRLRQDAKPIGFVLAPGGETWLFDPKSDGALFSRRALPADPAMLRVSCSPALLARLVTDSDFELRDDDDAVFEGDINDLLTLVSAFDESGSAIGLRARSSR
jgi:hypothetical protein